MNDRTRPTSAVIDAFIERWQHARGKERANYQLFLTELCQLLDLPGPEPAGALSARILHFNGTLFQDINPIPLSKQQIELLIDAARHNWSSVELNSPQPDWR